MTDDGPEWWEVIGDWCGWWAHVDRPEVTEILWSHCAPPLRLALATRWIGVTTGEVDPTITFPESLQLHPLVMDACAEGPVGLVDFGVWLAGYLSAMTVTGHGYALSPHCPGPASEPMALVQLDHGRLDLGIVNRDGAMQIAAVTITGGLTPV